MRRFVTAVVIGLFLCALPAAPVPDAVGDPGLETIQSKVAVTFYPAADGFGPEGGQTTNDPTLRNTAEYAPDTPPWAGWDPYAWPGVMLGRLASGWPEGTPIVGVTELFHIGVENASYRDLTTNEIVVQVGYHQTIRIFASVAQADATDPTQPELSTETAPRLVAESFSLGGMGIIQIRDSLSTIAPAGADYPFFRIRVEFEYANPIEAELGPIITLEEFRIPIEHEVPSGIEGEFTLEFDPEVDGVQPESGQTTGNPWAHNTALYDPETSPGRVLGTRDPAAPEELPLYAVTELFHVGVDDPRFLPLSTEDIVANVNNHQTIFIYLSTAQEDPANPGHPDPATESAGEIVMSVRYISGAVVVYTYDWGWPPPMPPGRSTPFVRLTAQFFYANPIEYDLGPFASIDRLTIPFEHVPEPAPPVFVAPTDPPCDSEFEWAAGKELAFEVSVTDPNGWEDVSLGVTGLPTGATLDPALPLADNPVTTRFAWTPAETDVGTHEITFSATDGTFTEECTFTVYVQYDQDGDGLPDLWEIDGYTHDNGQYVDLPAMGADPDRKDVFIEIDFMEGFEPGTAALQEIADAFAAAPVVNPDGSTGITLHVLVDEQLAHVSTLGTLDGGSYVWTAPDGSTTTHFDDLKADHFAEELGWSVHYCIWADKIPGDFSGMSRGIEANDFVVSLGPFIEAAGGTVDPHWESGTFMHELGHNLGLEHGGGDGVANKPNYLSVMNPAFQLEGLFFQGARGYWGYSFERIADLDESVLDERIGLQGTAAVDGFGTTWWMDGLPSVIAQQWRTAVNEPINWWDETVLGQDPVFEVMSLDINDSEDGLIEVLKGFNDWDHLIFTGGNVGAGVPLPPPVATPAEEQTIEEVLTFTLAEVVTGLKGHDPNKMYTLTWNPIKPQSQMTEYRVYRDGAQIAATTNTNHKDETVNRGDTHVYWLTWVNLLGQESVPGNKVTIGG